MDTHFRTVSYWSVSGDIVALKNLQSRWVHRVNNSPVFPKEKYVAEQRRITQEWESRKTPYGGGRSLDNDLMELSDQYRNVLFELNYINSQLESIYQRINGYIDELISDKRADHLSEILSEIQITKTLSLLKSLPIIIEQEAKIIAALK